MRTEESFPLFYPFEAIFACLRATECPFSLEAGMPAVLFFQRNDAGSNFTEPTILPSPGVLLGSRIPQEIRNLAKGTLDHTYTGFFVQDKWQATKNVTLNLGVRWDWFGVPYDAYGLMGTPVGGPGPIRSGF